jgi:hypothetical protein
MEFKKSGVIKALYMKAQADKAKAEMALDLLENQAVGIGDHTANDFFQDAEEALQLLIDASDKISLIEERFDIN